MADVKRRIGRPVTEIVLAAGEREALERYARGRTVSQALSLRARIVLACADGLSNDEVAERVGVCSKTVCQWRRRFAVASIEGLADLPRPNVDRKLSDEKVEELIRATLQTKPRGATHWSTRKLARRIGVSQSSVSRVWRAFQLKPHRHRTFSISTDDFFVDKVRNTVGLYMNPPDHAVAPCLDEKSQIQALERRQPILPLVFGQPERATPTYTRHGTTNLFAALDIATGKVIGECYARKRAAEFRRFLKVIDEQVPKELSVHVVVDNSSIHAAPEVKRWLGRHRRFCLHFTPTYSSWINLVERWFAKLTDEALRRGSHQSTRELRHAIERYIGATNDDPKAFRWTKTADEILAALARFCQRTLDQADTEGTADSGH
jgi:transposase